MRRIEKVTNQVTNRVHLELTNLQKNYSNPHVVPMRTPPLDELPQLWNILTSSISIIGPRPALWNQEDLLAERDKYGANSIKPGLTGWAQINGRDELEIATKARLDGEYAEKLKSGGWKAFAFDCRCFFGTISSVLKSEGVVEGGTGEMHKRGMK